MIDTVLGIVAAVLCVWGAVSFIRWVALSIASSKEENCRVFAVLLTGKEADISLQMAIETLEWDGALKNTRAYAVDGGLDPQMADYCRALCKNSRLTFVENHDAAVLKDLFSDQ